MSVVEEFDDTNLNEPDLNGNLLDADLNNLDEQVPTGCMQKVDKDVQTDLKAEELSKLFSEKLQLETKISSMSFNPESFVGNDTKTKYFTGLPTSKLLFLLADEICPHLYTQSPKLPPFLQLLITFMKLRFNFPNHYLSYRYTFNNFFR